MFSRYKAMKTSQVKDKVDQDPYPDPLSINYNNTQMSTLPKLRALNVADLQRFWVYMLKNYSIAEADDVLLTLNNVPYLGMLDAGSEIYLVDKDDLYNFGTQTKAGTA